MAVSRVGRRGEARGQPGRGLERWDEQGERPLTHSLRLQCHWHPSLPGRGSGLPRWHGGQAGRCPLASASAGPVVTASARLELRGESPTEAPGGSGVCPLRPATRWPMCLWGGPGILSLGVTAPQCQDLVLSAGTGHHCSPWRAEGLPNPQPKASELRDHSGGGWASTSWVPHLSGDPTGRRAPYLPLPLLPTSYPPHGCSTSPLRGGGQGQQRSPGTEGPPVSEAALPTQVPHGCLLWGGQHEGG